MTVKHKRHLVVPDTQVGPGHDLRYLDWVGRAIAHYEPDTLIMLGDWWDMASLSSYDKPGSVKMEGARYRRDVEVGNAAWVRWSLHFASLRRMKKHFLFGNHENRICRAVANDARLEGTLGLEHLETPGFTRHGFLERVWIDGIVYSHYFQNQLSAHAIGGSIDNRLNKIGDSFVQGHEQGFRYGNRVYPTGKTRHGLVAGSCYLHDEDYKGPQGNDHFRGIVVLNDVKDGDYCIMPLTLDYLRDRFGGRRNRK